MNAKMIGALFAACSVSLAAPVFAGGYDMAGTSASQHDHAAQATFKADGKRRVAHKRHDSGVGGSESEKSQSGKRVRFDSIDPMYRGG